MIAFGERTEWIYFFAVVAVVGGLSVPKRLLPNYNQKKKQNKAVSGRELYRFHNMTVESGACSRAGLLSGLDVFR